MSLFVEINGVQQRGLTDVGIVSVSVQQSVANRNTAQIVLLVYDTIISYQAGQQVAIGNGGTTYFVGTIQAPRRQWMNPVASIHNGARVATQWTLPCVSFDQIASHRIVETTQSYINQTAGAIVRNLATQFLGGENMGLGGVQDGPTIETFTVEAGTLVYEALDAAAEVAGMYWDILGLVALPELRLYARGSLASSWSITETTAIIAHGGGEDGITLEEDRRQAANDVWVELSSGPGSATQQDFVGDGVARDFTLDKPLDSHPRIEVDGVDKAVNLKDSGSASDWYYQPGSPTVTQDPTQPVLTTSNLLSVFYTPRERVVVPGARDNANIAARSAIEGGSGKYQVVISASDGATVADGTAAAAAYLAAHKDDGRRLTVRSIAAAAETLEIGQTISVNLPKVGAAGTFFCESVAREFFGKTLDTGEDVIMHRFTLSAGAVLGDAWTLLASAWSTGGGRAIAGGVAAASGGSRVVVQDLGVLTGDTTVTPSPASPLAGDLLFVTWEFGTTAYTLTWGTGFVGTSKAEYRPRTPSKHVFPFLYINDNWVLLPWRTDY